jgi:hypothetical protein
MRITIDEELCAKYNISFEELLMLLLVKSGVSIDELYQEMVDKEILVETNNLLGKSIFVTQRWDDVCSNILLDAEKSIPKEDSIDTLAQELMEVFPKGKKEGTNTYWRGNLKDTKLRLKKFFKLYGTKYTNEQIVNAAKKYVESFNGNYAYMRVLKYFIWKNVKKQGDEGMYIEETSDLASYIENEGQEDSLSKDWCNELV